ncbi:hypothetical protein [Sphingomonas gellani]|nr:hypothetical protein [Sphingomonas gellani]
MNSKAFGPFGYSNRWYDRLGGRNFNPKEFAMLLLVVVILAAIWQLS